MLLYKKYLFCPKNFAEIILNEIRFRRSPTIYFALLIICFLFIFLAIIDGYLVNVSVLFFHNCCEVTVFPAFSFCFLVILTTSLLRLNSSALHPARILWSQKRDGVIIILHFDLKNVLFQIGGSDDAWWADDCLEVGHNCRRNIFLKHITFCCILQSKPWITKKKHTFLEEKAAHG